MRRSFLALSIFLFGCETVAPVGGPPSPTASQALFNSYPEHLFAAANATCSGPARTLRRATRDQSICDTLPPPEVAAGIIIEFEGTVEEVPTLVISFIGQTTQQGYVVTVDSYLRVPNREGGAQEVRFPNTETQAALANLLTQAGGRPLSHAESSKS